VGPIQFVYWVGTLAVPPGSPDGSEAAPFPTLASALSAATALPDFSAIEYLLCDQDYSGEGWQSVPGNKLHRLVGQYTSVRVGTLNVATGSGGSSIELVNILSGTGIIGTGAGTLDIMCSSTNEFNGLVSINTAAIAAPVSIYLQNYTVNGINSPTGVLTSLAGDISGTVILSSYLSIIGTIFGATDITVAVAPTQQGIVGCVFNGIASFTGPAGSFRADVASGNQFFALGGSLLGGATPFYLENGFVYNASITAQFSTVSGMDPIYSCRIKATRSFFSCSLSLSSRIKLKNSAVSSNVSNLPSCK
jgi:hypothetical protein